MLFVGQLNNGLPLPLYYDLLLLYAVRSSVGSISLNDVVGEVDDLPHH